MLPSILLMDQSHTPPPNKIDIVLAEFAALTDISEHDIAKINRSPYTFILRFHDFDEI